MFEYLQYVTYFSFTLSLFTLLRGGSKLIHFKPFLAYVIVSTLLTLLTKIYVLIYKNAYPMYHISAIAEYLTIGYLFYSFSNAKKIILVFILCAICISIYESIILNRIMINNEIFMSYFNLSISFISIYVIVELSKSFHLRNSKFLALFSAGIFCQTSSSFIIGVYESEIRESVNSISIFVFYMYNIMALLQNVLNSFVFWKLKEA